MKRFGFLGRSVLVLGVLIFGLLAGGCDTTVGEDDSGDGNNPYLSDGEAITVEVRYTIEYVDPDTADTSIQGNTSYETAAGRESFVTHSIPKTFTSGVVTIEHGNSWTANVTSAIHGNDAWNPEDGATTTQLRLTLEMREGDASDFQTIQTGTINSLNAVGLSEMVTNY